LSGEQFFLPVAILRLASTLARPLVVHEGNALHPVIIEAACPDALFDFLEQSSR
jgi:hypothetical protein